MIDPEVNYKDWPDKRLKTAIQHLEEKNQAWKQHFKHTNASYTTMIKAFQEELNQRQKKISGGGEVKK